MAACGGSADAGKTTISFLSWDNEQIMKPFIDEFEKENPDIKVDFGYAPPTNEYIQTLQTRLVGNQAPDVFVITSENKNDLIDNGYALDMTGKSYVKKLSQANKDFLSRDGKLYGQSISSWAAGIAYNKDLLGQVGYDSVPATWDEFLDLCGKCQIRRRDKRGIQSTWRGVRFRPSTGITALVKSQGEECRYRKSHISFPLHHLQRTNWPGLRGCPAQGTPGPPK